MKQKRIDEAFEGLAAHSGEPSLSQLRIFRKFITIGANYHSKGRLLMASDALISAAELLVRGEKSLYPGIL